MFGLAIAPDGQTAYFSSSFQFVCTGCESTTLPLNALTAINLSTFAAGPSISLGQQPAGLITISPNGKTLYLGTSLYGTAVFAISLPALTISKTAVVAGAINIALSRNGSVLVAAATAYNSSKDTDTVTVLIRKLSPLWAR